MTRYVLITLLIALPVAAAPAERSLSFTKLWTHGHSTPRQVAEIPAFDSRTNTVWVAGVVGVDVLEGNTGTLIEHIDVTGHGFVNSVSIHNGLAAFAIEAGPPDRRNPGVVVFYDTRTRALIGDHDGTRAFVSLQDANGIAVLDLSLNAFTEIIGLGAKDFNVLGNEFDPKDDDGVIDFINADAKGLSMPDAVASYKWRGGTYLVMANEGDFREDNNDRSAAGGPPYFAEDPLDRLRISNRDSSPGNLFAAGARSMSIRAADGTLVYDSGSILDRAAHNRGIYDDGRSRDKGVEPEGVALLDIGGRTYAFVGLERTTISSVAVFDVTNPHEARFLDLIVTPGDLSPEGLVAFAYRGGFYLAISNEVPASGFTGLQHDALPGESSARIR